MCNWTPDVAFSLQSGYRLSPDKGRHSPTTCRSVCVCVCVRTCACVYVCVCAYMFQRVVFSME